MSSASSNWWASQPLRLSCAVGVSSLLIAAWIRTLSYVPDASLFARLQLTSGILAFTFAAIALVRFRGTHDRLPLVFAGGFVIVGFALITSSAVFVNPPPTEYDGSLRDPMAWVVSLTLLAVLLVAGLLVERRFPTSRNPSREIALALVIVIVVTAMLSAAHWRLPSFFVVQPGGVFPRPGNLIPAGLFFLAAIGYHARLKKNHVPFDRSLYLSAVMNLGSCLAASQSDRAFDSPFAFAEILQFASYVVLLGGALFDNAKLFDKIRDLAVSDSLTGLANHRQLVEIVEYELERVKRTGGKFALLLFDIDGLKKINDHFGHLVGTRAICRVADALSAHARTIDTAARQGGDEFALVLPETGPEGAQEVARRVCHRVAADTEDPPLSVSVGVAFYPQHGLTIEELFSQADQELYVMKRGHAAAPQPKKLAAV
jgi:diguanylate cyclase (GGDEF)-like protein